MKNNYYVIGLPVDHSLSPALHTKLYEIYGFQNCTYSALNVAPSRLSNFIRCLPEQNICGFNITMPLKADILPFLTHVDQSVYNGANTVVVRNGELFGYSTDAAGFSRSLLDHGITYSGKNIVVLGCGAVAQTLIHDALQKQAAGIAVLNRTVEKARQVAQKMPVQADSLEKATDYMSTCDILINTTPLGMAANNDGFTDLTFLRRLKPGACVCDLVYNPARTALLAQADALGFTTVNGLGMLIWQAFYAFELFFGILPGEKEYRIIQETLTACLQGA